MRIAKSLFFALPLCVMLVSSASAGVVFNLELIGTPIVDIMGGTATRTINVYALQTQEAGQAAPVASVFTMSAVTLLREAGSDTDIQFSTTIRGTDDPMGPNPSGFAVQTGTTGLGNLLGQVTATVMGTATSGDFAGVAFRATVAGNANLPIGANNGTFTSGGGTFLRVTAVPEPGTFGLLAMGGMGLTVLRRRRS